MQKKILIVDYTTHHPEVVAALMTLFQAQCVRLATTQRFHEKYLAPGGDPAFTIAKQVLVKGEGSEREWLDTLGATYADQDVVIFSTPLKSRLLARTLALPTRGRTVLFLHNVHYFLGIEPLDLRTYARLRAPRRSPLAMLPAWLLERMKFRRRQRRLRREHADFSDLDPRVDFYCFGSDSVASHFRARSGHARTVLLPTNAGGAARPVLPPYAGSLHIAIVGMISQARKDYRAVATALIGAPLRRPVVLSLLGSCDDPVFARELAELVRGNENPHLEIRFDPACSYIPAARLSELLGDVHILLSPIQPDTEFRFHREIYGQSKVSGTEGDSLAHGRPLLLPRSYACAERIEPLVVRYGDMRELVAAIDELNDAGALQALYARLLAVAARDFHGEMVAAFLRQVLPG
jgi:hypothetical protein